ncbi:DNA mismatch repair endonuclease MutL [Tichowtungia aerotolerans]|uniref:DNA mismatch repair protein MutL n=1 Tax=Tichowtungia aerotolerans TaxID=2697043 RepID=A0A6P1M3E1_9BACT|nr:DNA mismatch repair endonuclease MutL [Tichowtungia aerotolerans]QHI68622.1 DNA mismatch repair endonuclease MutL [Tichowtungia aerotolerans]
MKNQIQMLPDHVINKIAAGEVIERPASVMKELMENALDAGATQIDVEVVRGGMQLIAISDNGSGMDRDNALMAIERHATSKIRTAEEVEAVATLGFRGEALSSISAVSRFALITRPHDEVSGTEIRVAGGKLQDVADAGCPPGTRFEIRNLFFNVPARRKFLRTEATELAQIRQLFAVYALAHPETGLSLVSDGRELYKLPGGGSLADRIAELYNPSFFSHLRELDFEADTIKVTGFAGLPQTGRKDRSDQYIFINGRPAAAPVIYHAINEAYHSVLARGRHPSAFIFIETAPDAVDVNVHPAKKEVRFRRPAAVRDCVIAAIEKALALNAPIEEKRAPSFAFDKPAPAPRLIKQHELDIEMPSHRAPKAQSSRGTGEPGKEIPETPPERRNDEVAPVETVHPEQEGAHSAPWQWCRVLGQAGGTYAVLETEDGVVLMDPQAAHERVLFEKFMRDIISGSPAQQRLLTPETIELMPADAEALRRQVPALEEMGFGVSDFGQDTFLVDALPVHLQEGSPLVILSGIAKALDKGGAAARATREALRETVGQAACRAAVRAGDSLTIKELEKLVSDLAKTEMPYTCPHGRPTLIFQSFTELNRKFGRS